MEIAIVERLDTIIQLQLRQNELLEKLGTRRGNPQPPKKQRREEPEEEESPFDEGDEMPPPPQPKKSWTR